MREEFEKWFSDRTGWAPYIDESGKYKSMWAQLAWEAWQHPRKHPEYIPVDARKMPSPYSDAHPTQNTVTCGTCGKPMKDRGAANQWCGECYDKLAKPT